MEPKGRKAALSPPQVSVAQKWYTGSPATRHHQHHCSPHIGCPVTRAEHRSLFPLYGRSFLRHLKLSTIVYRANYFIFIVNLSMEEPISKTGLQYVEPRGAAESWPQDRPRGAPACRGTARRGRSSEGGGKPHSSVCRRKAGGETRFLNKRRVCRKHMRFGVVGERG